MEERKAKMPSVYSKLNTMLEGKSYFAGEGVSIADFQIYCEIVCIHWIKREADLDAYPNLKTWKARCDENKAIKEVHGDEWKGIVTTLSTLLDGKY
jgi:glutathione S-transferase